jgi:hypothetical protein
MGNGEVIAIINGVTVSGTPEEIEKYKKIAGKEKAKTDFFNVSNDVPEHVKRYGKNNTKYELKDSKSRAWF